MHLCYCGGEDYNEFFLVHSFKADVLSEEAILKWYNDAHLAKGKSVFLEQMKKFVEWLKNAEEGMQPFFSPEFYLPQLWVANAAVCYSSQITN